MLVTVGDRMAASSLSGLFFSSPRTRHLRGADVRGMLFMLGIYFLKRGATGATQEFLTHISFIEIWIETAQGSMPVRIFSRRTSRSRCCSCT